MKFVRMYSENYHLLTTGIEGSCTLNNQDMYACGTQPKNGMPGCNPDCDSTLTGAPTGGPGLNRQGSPNVPLEPLDGHSKGMGTTGMGANSHPWGKWQNYWERRVEYKSVVTAVLQGDRGGCADFDVDEFKCAGEMHRR